jgi:hypothetical protein
LIAAAPCEVWKRYTMRVAWSAERRLDMRVTLSVATGLELTVISKANVLREAMLRSGCAALNPSCSSAVIKSYKECRDIVYLRLGVLVARNSA